jgi:pSer/pThr/pTyr-binding forkhead associated (FHA) protein
LIWTEDENVWLEFNDHPMTSYSNNCIALNGWFNISNWPRPTNFAVTIVDINKPIVIKKGDPLFRLTFYSNDLNMGVILKKETDNNIIDKAWQKYLSNKEEAVKLTSSTWNNFTPLQHYSSSKKVYEDSQVVSRSHADFIYTKIENYNIFSDIEIEAKMKELALLTYLKNYN